MEKKSSKNFPQGPLEEPSLWVYACQYSNKTRNFTDKNVGDQNFLGQDMRWQHQSIFRSKVRWQNKLCTFSSQCAPSQARAKTNLRWSYVAGRDMFLSGKKNVCRHVLFIRAEILRLDSRVALEIPLWSRTRCRRHAPISQQSMVGGGTCWVLIIRIEMGEGLLWIPTLMTKRNPN